MCTLMNVDTTDGVSTAGPRVPAKIRKMRLPLLLPDLGRFVPSEHFRISDLEDKKNPPVVPIVGMDNLFREAVAYVTKPEQCFATTVSFSFLTQEANDREIISLMGGVGVVPISSGCLYQLLARHEQSTLRRRRPLIRGTKKLNLSFLETRSSRDLLVVCAVRYRTGWYLTSNYSSSIDRTAWKPRGCLLVSGNQQPY